MEKKTNWIKKNFLLKHFIIKHEPYVGIIQFLKRSKFEIIYMQQCDVTPSVYKQRTVFNSEIEEE